MLRLTLIHVMNSPYFVDCVDGRLHDLLGLHAFNVFFIYFTLFRFRETSVLGHSHQIRIFPEMAVLHHHPEFILCRSQT